MPKDRAASGQDVLINRAGPRRRRPTGSFKYTAIDLTSSSVIFDVDSCTTSAIGPAAAAYLLWPVFRYPPSASKATAIVARLRIDQMPGVLEIFGADGIRRSEGQCSERTGRIVSGVLRKAAGASDEEVRYVPALQIAIDGAGVGISARDRAATEMSGSILRDVVWPPCDSVSLRSDRGVHHARRDKFASLKLALANRAIAAFQRYREARPAELSLVFGQNTLP